MTIESLNLGNNETIETNPSDTSLTSLENQLANKQQKLDELKATIDSPMIVNGENLEEKAKDKNGKKEKKKPIIWDRVFRKRNIEKLNKVAVLYLRNNNKAEALELEARRGFFTINGKTYNEDKDCVFTMGKERLPLAVIREDSLIPEGNSNWTERAMKEKCFALQDQVIRGVKHAEFVRMGEKEPMRLSGKAIVGIIIAGIVLMAFIMNYV